MSVIVSKRKPQQFAVLTKAYNLAVYTAQICANEKNFPKKYRWMLTQQIVQLSFNIVTDIRMANAINVQNGNDFKDRRQLQIKANSEAEALLTLIEIAWKVMSLQSQQVEYWTGLVVDLEENISSWRDSDRRRFTDLIK